MQSPLKILAIDDHPFYIDGMLTCLKQWTLVGHVVGCTNYDDMLGHLKRDEPHLVFIELNLNTSRYDGFSICREVSARYRNVFIAVLSRYNTPGIIKEAQECGARAFLDKNNTTEKLYNFLHDFWQGKILQYYVQVSGGSGYQTTTPVDGFELKYILTRREREVMAMIVEGREHYEIENELAISYSTYKTHRSNILRKLGLKNEVALTRFAVSNALCNTVFASQRYHLPPTHQPQAIY